MRTEFKTGIGVSAPITLFHAPCAFNPKGVSGEVCKSLTCISFRNLQGCVKIECTSPERLCRKCVVENDTPAKVINSESGLCERHSEHELSAELSLSRFEQRLATPDYTTLPALNARFRRYASANANTAVGSGGSAPEAVVLTAQELSEKIPTLTNRLYETALNIAHGDSVEVEARSVGRNWKSVAADRNSLYKVMAIPRRVSPAERQRLFFEAFKLLGFTIEVRTPEEEPPVIPLQLDEKILRVASLRVKTLSKHERDVLKQLALGKSNEEIGQVLCKSKQHISNIVSAVYRVLRIQGYGNLTLRRVVAAHVWNAYKKQDI